MQSIPIFKIGAVLMVSIQVDLTDASISALQEKILSKIEKSDTEALLIEISGIDMVDSYIARVLSETARMAKFMNVQVVLAGMQPGVAITLVEMGLDMPDVQTAIDAELALSALGYKLEKVEQEVGDQFTGAPRSHG